MTTIKKHLEKEKNLVIITELEKILSRGTLTFNEWSSLGKFSNVDQVDRKVLKSCKQVIEYPGDAYLQVLNDGEYYYTSKVRGKSLHEVEMLLWIDIAEKLWCESC